MNGWVLRQAFRQQYRTYALRISVIAHVILIIVLSFVVIRSEMQEAEDEIHVEFFRELPRELIVKKQIIQQPVVEPENTPTPIREKIPIQKPVRLSRPEASMASAKMPLSAPTAVDIQKPTEAKIEVDVPIALSTDTDLPTAPESVLSPSMSAEVGNVESRYTGRSGVIKNPRKGTDTGINKRAQKTRAGQEIGNGVAEIGAGAGQGLFETGPEQPTFRSVIQKLTEDIIISSTGAAVDVVFVVDASGSMGDNINAVAEHLGEMVDTYKASEIDYQLGLTHFSINEKNQNRIHVFQLTQDLSKYKAALSAIELGGDEHALDAINETLMQMRFRSNAVKHLIVVTDEPFTSLHGFTVDDAINLCRKNKVFVNVLGNDEVKHKWLAAVTGGTWHAIPVNP